MVSVNEILKDVQSLPALPGTALRIIMMLSGSEVDLDEVKEIIRLDEAITIVVLRNANSVAYGIPGKTFSLEESIVRLGTKRLLKIVLEQQVSRVMAGAGASYGLRRGSLWRGSLGGALATEELAEEINFENVELCFLCALLRDIGKLAFDAYFGPDRILECASNMKPGMSFLETEREMLGVDHAELGGALAEHWDLPERIANAIRYHHKPPLEDERHDDLYDLVHAGDMTAMWMGLAIGHDGLHYSLADHVMNGILGSREQSEQIIMNTWKRLNELEADVNETTFQGKGKSA